MMKSFYRSSSVFFQTRTIPPTTSGIVCHQAILFLSQRNLSGINRRVHRSSNNNSDDKDKGRMTKTISLLDDPSLEVDRSRPIRQRAKISQPLEKPAKLVLDEASRGMSQAIADDMMDNMNDALSSNDFIGVFKGVDYASQVVEISSVRLNQDFSHAHVTWRSRYIEDLLEKFQEKDLSENDVKMAEKMTTNINDILQRNEGKFRSHFIKSVNFRRVPRIYFQKDQYIEDLLKVLSY